MLHPVLKSEGSYREIWKGNGGGLRGRRPVEKPPNCDSKATIVNQATNAKSWDEKGSPEPERRMVESNECRDSGVST